MSKACRQQPSWSPPSVAPGADLPPLKLFNSLTNQKEVFVPEQGRKVKWYGCGPTVYDASHMGHARSYISFDIMRRILRDYFKFDVLYVMNITDVDDKIIKRARQNYLVQQYGNENRTLDSLKQDVTESLQKLEGKIKKETDKDKLAMYERDRQRVKSALASTDAALILSEAKDSLADWLDNKLGSTVTDNKIFEDLPRFWEREFFKDMHGLNIEDPDRLTRVSEYIQPIVDYCKRIIDAGFAYESNGSVYFDTNKFANTEGHFYAKLVPNAYGDEDMLKEGEGDLSISAERLQEKRSAADFALWKASKPGEPAWASPWGQGRPGWHIECSVMASDQCGASMDIHTGGVDLKFPHHDNELAQAEAYYGHSHWVRYFLHAGHLTISGCKMSKSLKNFITIREALSNHSMRRLRFAFLLHSWKDTLDYSENTMQLAVSYEKLIADFFFTTSHYLEMDKAANTDPKMEELVVNLKKQVYDFLCDNLDTRSVFTSIQDAIFTVNTYIQNQQASAQAVNAQHLKTLAVYVTQILDIFGTISHSSPLPEEYFGFEILDNVSEVTKTLVSIGINFSNKVVEASGCDDQVKTLCSDFTVQLSTMFGIQISVDANLHDQLSRLDLKSESSASNVQLASLLRHIASLRHSVRQLAREHKLKTVLQLCDKLRDDELAGAGVRLQDRDSEKEPPAIQLFSQQILKEEQAERIRKEQEKTAAKSKKTEQVDRGSVPPEKLFVGDTDKFSAFDERGLPTHDAQGKEMSKSALKKLHKLWDAQEKRHSEWKKQ